MSERVNNTQCHEITLDTLTFEYLEKKDYNVFAKVGKNISYRKRMNPLLEICHDEDRHNIVT